jgi:hypothetical protein
MSITLHNIPQTKDENLMGIAMSGMSALDVQVEAGHIANCRRIRHANQTANQSNKAPMIIMTFISPFYRNLVWRKYIAEKSLTVKDVLPNLAVDSRVYVNLMLNPMKNRIKNEVMRLLITRRLHRYLK